MSRLLHVSASPRGENSESLQLAATILDTYRELHPEVEIDHFDLWDGTLPPFGPAGASAKMTVFSGSTPDGDEAKAWEQVQQIFARFAAADAYLFTVPMWNGGVPYVLKQWIDIITQPGLVFGFTPEGGYTGLIAGKKAAAIYTSAVYSPGAGPQYGRDFHATFFTDWLNFCGITDVTEIRFQPTVLTASPDDDRDAAHAVARDAAKTF
jgi:FMN-dependent NADH-azoreductase